MILHEGSTPVSGLGAGQCTMQCSFCSSSDHQIPDWAGFPRNPGTDWAKISASKTLGWLSHAAC